MYWNFKRLFDVETVSARIKQRCTPVAQQVSSIDIDTIHFVGSSKANLSYDHPAQVQTLGRKEHYGDHCIVLKPCVPVVCLGLAG